MSGRMLRESSGIGSSPEDIMRKIFLRWINYRMDRSFIDLRDMFRSEHLIGLAEICLGGPVANTVLKPALPADHDTNYDAIVQAVSAKTKVEWGASKLTSGLKAKQLGFLEILLWHLVEVGELAQMGLPIGHETMTVLAQAIEERLSKFIKLKQFHFRYTKEMIFDIVHDCSSWEPDPAANDVQNLRSAFDNISGWGIPTLVDPADIKNMGSVNERGFLMFFAFFLPSLEGIAGPKKQKQVAVVDTSAFTSEIERLKAQISDLEREISSSKSRHLMEMEESNSRFLASESAANESIGKLNATIEDLRRELTSVRSDFAKERLQASAVHENEIKELKAKLLNLGLKGDEALEQAQNEIRVANESRMRDIEQLNRLFVDKESELIEAHQKEIESLRAAYSEQAEQGKASSSGLQQEIARLKQLLQQETEAKKAQSLLVIQARSEAEDLQIELDELKQSVGSGKKVAAALADELRDAQTQMQVMKQSLSNDAQIMRQKWEESQQEARKLQEKMDGQKFDVLEQRCAALGLELAKTSHELSEAQQETAKMEKQLRGLELKMPLFMRQGKNLVDPPQGDVTLVFTDVEGSTVQWEWNPDVMAVAIRKHNEVLREMLQQHGGYEVKTEGDAFMCSFADPLVAVRFCLDTQEKLLQVDWPQEIYEHEKSQIVKNDDGQLLYRGLRVRMGLHCGNPSCEEDPTTGRMDYFGQMVNRAARVESVASGGQVVMSSDVHDRVLSHLGETRFNPDVKDLGKFELKGLVDSTHIYQILPESLKGRTFAAVQSKESALADEKKKLEDQLREMKERNSMLAMQLNEMDRSVKEQAQQANALLSEVQEANFSSLDPAQMLKTLHSQLVTLVQGQSATAGELEKAKSANEELFRLANESAERREKIANQTFELQRLKLENVISSGKEEIERRQLAEQELMARVAALEAELAETSQKSSQDLEASKAELADLQSEIANLKSVSAKRESALRGEMDAAEEEHARAMEEARSIHASQVEAAKAEAERINNLRGLQAAMAHRIESLEGVIDGSSELASQSAAILHRETIKWAAIEKDLKEQIKSLESRLRKSKAKLKAAGII